MSYPHRYVYRQPVVQDPAISSSSQSPSSSPSQPPQNLSPRHPQQFHRPRPQRVHAIYRGGPAVSSSSDNNRVPRLHDLDRYQPLDHDRLQPQPRDLHRHQPHEFYCYQPLPHDLVRQRPRDHDQPQPHDLGRNQPQPRDHDRHQPQPQDLGRNQPHELDRYQPQPRDLDHNQPQPPRDLGRNQPQPSDPDRHQPQARDLDRNQPQPRVHDQPQDIGRNQPRPRDPDRHNPEPRDRGRNQPQPRNPDRHQPQPSDRNQPQELDRQQPQPRDPDRQQPRDHIQPQDQPQPHDLDRNQPQPRGLDRNQPQPTRDPDRNQPQPPRDPDRDQPQPPRDPDRDQPQPQDLDRYLPQMHRHPAFRESFEGEPPRIRRGSQDRSHEVEIAEPTSSQFFPRSANAVLATASTGVNHLMMTSDRPAGPPLAAPSSPKNLNPAAPVFRQQDKGRGGNNSFPSDLVSSSSSDKDYNLAAESASLGSSLTNGDVHHIMSASSNYQSGVSSSSGASRDHSPATVAPASQHSQMATGSPGVLPPGGDPQPQSSSFPASVSQDAIGSGQGSAESGQPTSGMFGTAGGGGGSGGGGEPVDGQSPSQTDNGGEEGDHAADSTAGGGVNDAAAELAGSGEETTYPEEIIAPIKKQLEYYFSSENLPNDKYINTHMDINKFVPLELFSSFNRMKPICSSVDQMVQAVQMSSLLELNEDKTKVRISQTRKTLTLRSLPPNASEDDVRRVLEENDCPKPQHVEMITLTKAPVSNWYVSFASEDECLDAFFKLHNTKVFVDGYSIGCCIKSSGTLAATGSFPTQDENQQRQRIAQQSQQTTSVASVASLTQQPTVTSPAVAAAAAAATAPQQPTALMQPFNPMPAMHPALMASAGQGLYYNQNTPYLNMPYMTGMITQTWPGAAAATMEPGLMLQGSGLQPQHIRTQLPRQHLMQNTPQRFSRPQRPNNRQNNLDKSGPGGVLDRSHDRGSSSASILPNSRNSPRGIDNNPSNANSILSSIPRRSANIRDDVTVTIGGSHQTSAQQQQQQHLVSAIISQPHTVTVGPASSSAIVNPVLDTHNTVAASVSVPPTPVSVPVHNPLMQQQHHHQQQQQPHQQHVHHPLHPQPLMPNLTGSGSSGSTGGSNPQTSNQSVISQHQHQHHHPSHHQSHQPHQHHHHHQPPPPIHHHQQHQQQQQQQHQSHQNQHHQHHHPHHHNQQSISSGQPQHQQHIPSQHQAPPPPTHQPHQPPHHHPQHQQHHPQHHHPHQQPPMHTPSHQHHHHHHQQQHHHHPSSGQHHQQNHPHHHPPHHQGHHHGGMMPSQHHQHHHQQPPQQQHPHPHQMLPPSTHPHHHHQHSPFGGRPDPRRNKKRRDETNLRNPRERQPARSNFSSQVPPIPDNFTMEANSFPPLPGAASSTPSSEASQENNRTMHSDIVKGVARVPSMNSSAPPPSATRGTSSSSTPSPIPIPGVSPVTAPHLPPTVGGATQVVVDPRTASTSTAPEETDSITGDDTTSSSQEEADVDVSAGVSEPVAMITRQFRQEVQVSSGTSEQSAAPSTQNRYASKTSSTPTASNPTTYVNKLNESRHPGGSNSQMTQQQQQQQHQLPRSHQPAPSAATQQQQQQQQQQQMQQLDQQHDSNKERLSYAQILANKRENAAANELNAAAAAANNGQQAAPASTNNAVVNGPNGNNGAAVSSANQGHQNNYANNSGRSGGHNNIGNAFREQGNYMQGHSSRPQSQRLPKEAPRMEGGVGGPHSRLPNGRRNSKENRAQGSGGGGVNSSGSGNKHDRRKPDGRPK